MDSFFVSFLDGRKLISLDSVFLKQADKEVVCTVHVCLHGGFLKATGALGQAVSALEICLT